jgi:NTE family protein
MNKETSIGLSLSGGGARGAAHIGVLQGLNELGIFPSHVSGSSAGALIGAFYCSGYTPKEIQELSISHSFMKFYQLGFSSKGLTNPKFLFNFLKKHLKSKDFKSLKIPLSVGVTNIDKGLFTVLQEGDLIKAIMASCAIPILFKPVEIDGDLHLDGGLMNNLPIEPLQVDCQKIIGVGICPHHYNTAVSGITEIGLRSFHLAIWNTMEHRMNSCDVAIDVLEVEKFWMFDFKNVQGLYDIGYKAVMDQKEELLKLIQD